jgi:ribokinase
LGAVGETNAALIRRHYDLVEKSGLVLITGYWALAGFRPGVENLLRKMKSDGKLVFLDPGWNPDGWPESSRREMLRLLPLIDVFLPNYPEAKALSRKNRPEEMGKSLCRAGAGEVIIKMDDHGSAGYSEKEGFQKRNALKIKAVDTTAAGEAFNAGVIYGLIQKWPLTNRLTFANTLAGLTIADPQAPCPSLDKVLGKMKGAYAGIC